MTSFPNPYFEWRALTVAKDVDFPQENMDAFAVDAERGTAAMTDGAASGLFSGPWARLVAEAVRDDPPDPDDEEAARAWLAERRREWRERIDLKNLNFFQREKLRQWGGGSTTLVWCELTPADADGSPHTLETQDTPDTVAQDDAEPSGEYDEFFGLDEESAWDPDEDSVETEWELQSQAEPDPEPTVEDEPVPRPAQFRLRGWAVGDTCLFRVRGREVLWSFPLTSPDEFSQDPQVLGSVPRGDDPLPPFSAFEDRCEPGDLLVMATDAFAWWLITRATDADACEPIDWDALWEMDEERWREHVVSLRREQGVRHDDTTVLLLRVLPWPADRQADHATDATDEAGGGLGPEWFAPFATAHDAGPWQTESFTTNDPEPDRLEPDEPPAGQSTEDDDSP